VFADMITQYSIANIGVGGFLFIRVAMIFLKVKEVPRPPAFFPKGDVYSLTKVS